MNVTHWHNYICFNEGLLKTDGVQVVQESPRKNQIKETDSDYIKLAKKGGHSGNHLALGIIPHDHLSDMMGDALHRKRQL